MNKSDGLISLALGLGLLGCSSATSASSSVSVPGHSSPLIETHPSWRHITILSTNDIHGAVEPTAVTDTTGTHSVGGMAMISGIFKSIRQGITNRYGDIGGTITIDGGDQFQGTLISNYNEGQLVYNSMAQMGYDALVPGNHAYDFGPVNWLLDRAQPDPHTGAMPNPSSTKGSRGALIQLIKNHPTLQLVSANTYFKSSIVDTSGHGVELSSASGCRPKDPQAKIDWTQAKRPSFVAPYVIKKVAGIQVAIIGIDFLDTPTTTTPENVSDLCFRGEVDSYLEVRNQLEGKADLFVMLIHNGVVAGKDLITQITVAGPSKLHAVIAGHTHQVERALVNNVPIIQSGANGSMFGRINLVWDTVARAAVVDQTEFYSGIHADSDRCDKFVDRLGTGTLQPGFCEVVTNGGPDVHPTGKALSSESTKVVYEGVPVIVDSKIEQEIARWRQKIAVLASRKIGHAAQTVARGQGMETPLSDFMTDELRAISGADVSFMNTGGIRADLPAGDNTYEDLFRVIPFNNHGLVIGPMTLPQIIDILLHTAKSCNNTGLLAESGLKIVVEKDCSRAGATGIDSAARLVSLKTAKDEILFDDQHPVDPNRNLIVATLDFLAAGGSGYSEFIGVPLYKGGPHAPDLGIVREIFADDLAKRLPEFPIVSDGRVSVVAP